MPQLSPQTLTTDEQQALLKATRSHPRDHLIVSLALGTGLRLGELVGLNVGDVFFPDGEPRTRVHVRPEIAKRGRVGDVFLPDALVPKLRKFWAHKRTRGESVDPSAPLLCGISRRRISRRRVQVAIRAWQVKAGFDLYGSGLMGIFQSETPSGRFVVREEGSHGKTIRAESCEAS